MRILLVAAISLLLSSLIRAQEPGREIHINCPVTRESVLQLDWPRVVKSVVPAYPSIAAAKRISGSVRVDIDISPKGSVTAARVITGEKLLRDAAQKSALLWTFRPTDIGARSIPLNFIFRDVDYVASKDKPECGLTPYTVEILWPVSP